MSTVSQLILEISFIVNFALIGLLLSMVYPKLIERYKKRRKRRETQKVSQIKRIVRDYLKELQK
jgi:predicted membrane protein|tara:strand:- start:531 stop:722 length:192 start_codon:yes stop_codon:yes gene_type:complete